MRIHAKSSLTYQFAYPSEVLLLIEAAHSSDQRVISENLTITPGVDIVRKDDPMTGERRLVFTAQGQVDIHYEARVERPHSITSLAGLARTPVAALPVEALRYLRASHYCPSDRLQAFVMREFGTKQGGDNAAAIIDWVGAHVDYRFGVSDTQTTGLDTFVDRAGVCRDFTHLAITLLRAAGIPARAVSAYACKLDPPDMHAIVEVYLAGSWWLVDPTGKAPIDGLVRIATGLDATDIAFMTIFGQGTLVWQSFSAVMVPEAAAA
ncbi:MAG: transglutaminase family protein [Alphaproteobacteria bacterium]